ncbi:hypothetical protein NLG42_14380 [Flavobacterium plurextorum]|uniref:MauE/DoxX family redox-associated membrane protein n=1 Tax=Flavobacterium TaxID=237 RepID=UPI00214DA868|nr:MULTISPECIES: MauE/DoxX family redox-associated membrane protein [Flavobacterium]UUW07291.1 hypothetical protein NLG42_14380 [Flavobacterium plurextorum]
MKLNINTGFKKYTIEVICILYILLFVYAAVSKLLDFENFQVQLGQSPLISSFAAYLAFLVPVAEIVIAVLLAVPKFRKVGLYAGFGLMVIFSIYIYLILNYSSYIPCSCGGILEKMNWDQHFYFNIFFSVLAFIALNCLETDALRFYKRITVSIVSCIILMVGLYIRSDQLAHKQNNFTRIFPPFPATREAAQNLKANTYYFAGQNGDKVYLGNPTAPAVITEVRTDFGEMRTYHFQITDTLFRFLNIKLKVIPPYFFVYDGKVPCIFRGRLNKLKAELQTARIPGFTKASVIDSTTFIIRNLNNKRENLLSLLDISSSKLQPSYELLQKQSDGLFDTDGILQYSKETEKFVYLYYYRNEYIVTDDKLKLLHRGNTIDTTSKASLKIEYIKSKNQRTFSNPPLLVNRLSTLHRNLLFVNSMLPGRFEGKKMWQNANVIDVYDVLNKSYLMSFYIYKVDGEKIDDMIATDSHIYIITGSRMVSYKFSDPLKNKIKF